MIAGTPEAYIPFPETALVIGLANDSLPNSNEDDHRTAAGRLAYRVGDLVFAADMSVFTDFSAGNGPRVKPSDWHRTDEARATAGWTTSLGTFGAGVAYVGDLGGGHLQDSVHRLLCTYAPGGEYDLPGRNVDALGYWSHGGDWWDAAAIVSTAGTVDARAGLRQWYGPVMVGGHGEAHGGHWPTRTIAYAMTAERGAWVDLAVAGQHWSLSGSFNPVDRSTWWTLAVGL